MKTIEIREVEDIPVCGDGCCHDDGLMVDVSVDGKFEDNFFYQTESKFETGRLVELIECLYGKENVKFIPLKH